MSGFQKSVKLYPAVGVPGQEVNPGQAIYTAENYISDGTLTAGAFAFTSAVTGTGTAAAFKAAGKTGTALIGFVERTVTGAILSPLNEAEGAYAQEPALPSRSTGSSTRLPPAP